MEIFFSKVIKLLLVFSIFSYISSSSICSPGYYISEYGCIPCPGGFYSQEEDSISCYECPAGTYSTTASKSCIPCEKGSYF